MGMTDRNQPKRADSCASQYSIMEFMREFPDDAACLDYLEWLRWQNGFECPRCKVPGGWRLGDGRFWCEQCRRRASVTAGTIFHRTRTPLTVWFAAAWHVTSTKNGVSAKTLQRLLGFGSYQTAWTMLHRFRAAMVRPGRDRLAGTVEVDESYVGGPEKGVRSRTRPKPFGSINSTAITTFDLVLVWRPRTPFSGPPT